MSLIRQYKEIKGKNEIMIENLLTVMGKGSRIDKNYIGVYSDRRWSSNPVIGYLHGQYGYYGDSSVSDVINPTTTEYIRGAINKMMPQIVTTAIELARQDIEKARIAASKEAQEVLEEVSVPKEDVK